MKPAPRSCYVLELSVEPGGSRWAELHAYTDPRHLHALLTEFCSNPGGISAYHAIIYGARLGVWIVQRGEVARFVDLHPHITARLGRAGPVALTDTRGLRELTGPIDDGYEEDLPERIELGVAWPDVAAALPALEEPRLAPGERTPIRHAGRRPRGAYLGIVDHVPLRLRGRQPRRAPAAAVRDPRLGPARRRRRRVSRHRSRVSPHGEAPAHARGGAVTRDAPVPSPRTSAHRRTRGPRPRGPSPRPGVIRSRLRWRTTPRDSRGWRTAGAGCSRGA
ncbi:MAG: hypothetical protein JNL82_34945 [Myxococcales bacterium]|nr:hypothetical protein [Myxococcales bacterium]